MDRLFSDYSDYACAVCRTKNCSCRFGAIHSAEILPENAVRFDRVETSGDIHFSAEEPEMGTAVFTLKSGTVVYIGTSTSLGEDLDYIALVDWLLSEPGRATIADFRQEGSQVAFPVEAVEAATVEVVIVGDLENGRELSTNHCRRCHKVDRADKYAGIGNSPSSCDALV